jgi:ATP-dependent Clp endopeptidase proteolytic subunit ClpP
MGDIKVYSFIGKKRNAYDTNEYMSGQQFTDALATATSDAAEEVVVRVSSGGGSVTDGHLMFNAMKSSGKKVHAIIDGFAASMGYFFLLGASKITAAKNSLIMVHSVQGGASGSPDELRKEAEVLDKFNASIAQALADRTGLTVEEVTAKYLGEEVWFTAQEALDAKLIDAIDEFEAELPEVTAGMSYEEASMRFAAMHSKSNSNESFLAQIKKVVREAIGQVETKEAALVNNLDHYARSFYDDMVWAEQCRIGAAKYAIANSANATVVGEAKQVLSSSLTSMNALIIKVYGEKADAEAVVKAIGETRAASQAEVIEAAITKDVTAKLSEKDNVIKALTDKVTTLEAAPAAAPSAVTKEKDDISASGTENKERQKTAAEEKRDRMAAINEFDITKATLED